MNTSTTHIHALALYRDLKAARPAPAPRRDFRLNNLASQADRLTLTGETDPIAQCAACERLGIAYYRRVRAGWTTPECNVWLDETTHDRLLAAEAAMHETPVQLAQCNAAKHAIDTTEQPRLIVVVPDDIGPLVWWFVVGAVGTFATLVALGGVG